MPGRLQPCHNPPAQIWAMLLCELQYVMVEPCESVALLQVLNVRQTCTHTVEGGAGMCHLHQRPLHYMQFIHAD